MFLKKKFPYITSSLANLSPKISKKNPLTWFRSFNHHKNIMCLFLFQYPPRNIENIEIKYSRYGLFQEKKAKTTPIWHLPKYNRPYQWKKKKKKKPLKTDQFFSDDQNFSPTNSFTRIKLTATKNFCQLFFSPE